jgi:hypothetical protein
VRADPADPALPRQAGAAYFYSYDSDGDPVLIDAAPVGTDGPDALHPPTGGAKSRQACESPGARE